MSRGTALPVPRLFPAKTSNSSAGLWLGDGTPRSASRPPNWRLSEPRHWSVPPGRPFPVRPPMGVARLTTAHELTGVGGSSSSSNARAFCLIRVRLGKCPVRGSRLEIAAPLFSFFYYVLYRERVREQHHQAAPPVQRYSGSGRGHPSATSLIVALVVLPTGRGASEIEPALHGASKINGPAEGAPVRWREQRLAESVLRVPFRGWQVRSYTVAEISP